VPFLLELDYYNLEVADCIGGAGMMLSDGGGKIKEGQICNN
jgi:hypothetical protein